MIPTPTIGVNIDGNFPICVRLDPGTILRVSPNLIATAACRHQVARNGGATILPEDYVIDSQRNFPAAVSASITVPLENFPSDPLIDLTLALPKNCLPRPANIEHVGLIQEPLPLSGIHYQQFVFADHIFVRKRNEVNLSVSGPDRPTELNRVPDVKDVEIGERHIWDIDHFFWNAPFTDGAILPFFLFLISEADCASLFRSRAT